jgi:serine/threonine-protein phosphatase 6 regulatory ankyrin repeat subunit A/serine/threonine-protein phosphatase 6 regulatory ankyrin repeat subunit B
LRDVAQVRSLLAAGADANEKAQGDYPLNIAATYGPAEMVTILLEAGAGIEQPGRDGLQPLHNAVILGHKDIVALLMQKGAIVDAKDRLGRTPLINFAARGGGEIEIPKMLLAAGADPDIESAKDDENRTVLDFAAATGNLELAELLIAAHVDVNHRDIVGYSALHTAVKTHHLEIVRLLLSHGADINIANELGKTPLYYASNNAAMRQVLVEAGAK